MRVSRRCLLAGSIALAGALGVSTPFTFQQVDAASVPVGQTILLQATNNNYVSACTDQTNIPLEALVTQVQAWEQFRWGQVGGPEPGAPNFGPNVFIFDPTMSSSTLQNTLNSVFNQQQSNQFGANRYAFLGLLFDAGSGNSPVLLQVGPSGSSLNHAANPTLLADVFFRIGGAAATRRCVYLIHPVKGSQSLLAGSLAPTFSESMHGVSDCFAVSRSDRHVLSKHSWRKRFTPFASMEEKQWKQDDLFCVKQAPSSRNNLPFALAE